MPTPTATIFLPYHALDEVIQRGPRAQQPDASDVVPGTLYSVTDEANLLERSDGTVWAVYVPVATAGRIFYYAPSDASDIVGYKTLLEAPSTAAETTIAVECAGTGDVLVEEFATNPGVPGVVTYPAGTAYRRIYARTSAASSARLHLQIFVRNQAGVETLVRDEVSHEFTNTAVALQEWLATPGSGGTLQATDRIVNKLYAQRVSGPATITVTVHFEGITTGSHIQTTISSGSVGSAGPGVAAGGTPGQVLVKTSSADYATGWQTGTAPTAHHATHEPGGADALTALSASTLTSGTVADARLSSNIPRLDAFNVFSQQQLMPSLFVSGPAASVDLYDTAGVADGRRWLLDAAGSEFNARAVSDAGATQATPLVLDRTGNIHVQQYVYERGRSVPLGHWQNVPFNAANFTANPGTWTVAANNVAANRYTVIGQTLIWVLYLVNTTPSGSPTTLYAVVPGGFTLTQAAMPMAVLQDGGGQVAGYVSLSSGTLVQILKYGAGAYSGNTHIAFTYIGTY